MYTQSDFTQSQQAPLSVARVSQRWRNYAGKQGNITKFNMFAHVLLDRVKYIELCR